jgi:hypothetical protein
MSEKHQRVRLTVGEMLAKKAFLECVWNLGLENRIHALCGLEQLGGTRAIHQCMTDDRYTIRQ